LEKVSVAREGGKRKLRRQLGRGLL
jgi:hypothetical protein